MLSHVLWDCSTWLFELIILCYTVTKQFFHRLIIVKGGVRVQRLLEKLFHTYYKDIYRYLYSLTHDASLSEDLTSEVFLEVM